MPGLLIFGSKNVIILTNKKKPADRVNQGKEAAAKYENRFGCGLHNAEMCGI